MLENQHYLLDELRAETPEPQQTIDDIINLALIPQGVEIPKPELIFGMDEIPMFTKKSLSVLKGPAKVGKTTATAWLTAQVIREHINVLWIDTEQGMYYASRTQHWVLRIAGFERCEYLNMYDLKIHNPTKRIEIIENLIKREIFDMIILDGIRDLVFDINSPEEATNITGNLMRWADLHNCHILSIIHQNKGSDHARGHLGSELINKAETVIKVSKSDDNIVTCEPEFTRGMPFEMFGFERDSYGIPNLVTVRQSINTGESNVNRLQPTDLPESQHLDILRRAFNGAEELSYGDLQSDLSAVFANDGSNMGINKIKTFISWYTQKPLLEKTRKVANKTYYKIIDQK